MNEELEIKVFNRKDCLALNGFDGSIINVIKIEKGIKYAKQYLFRGIRKPDKRDIEFVKKHFLENYIKKGYFACSLSYDKIEIPEWGKCEKLVVYKDVV